MQQKYQLPTIITFFGIVQQIYIYFSGYTSRWDKLKIALKVTLKSHCSTRWSTKKQAVSALKNNLKGLFELLKTLSEDCTMKM